MREEKRALENVAQDMKEGANDLKDAQSAGVTRVTSLLAKTALALNADVPRELRRLLDVANQNRANATQHFEEGLGKYRNLAGNLIAFGGPAQDIDQSIQRAHGLVTGDPRITQPGELPIPGKLVQLYEDVDSIESIFEVLRDTVGVTLQRARDLNTHFNAVEGVARDTADQINQYKNQL